MPEDLPDSSLLDTTLDVDGFFRELVGQVIKSRGYEPSTATSSYVVGLLADSAKPNPATLHVMGSHSFTMMLADAPGLPWSRDATRK